MKLGLNLNVSTFTYVSRALTDAFSTIKFGTESLRISKSSPREVLALVFVSDACRLGAGAWAGHYRCAITSRSRHAFDLLGAGRYALAAGNDRSGVGGNGVGDRLDSSEIEDRRRIDGVARDFWVRILSCGSYRELLWKYAAAPRLALVAHSRTRNRDLSDIDI